MGLFSDGTPDDSQLEQAVQDKQRAQIHSALQQQNKAFNRDGQLRTDYLETLVAHGLDEETVQLLRNLVSQDYVLANYNRAEVREAGWLARCEFKRVTALHPGEGAILQGELRQFMFDDAEQGLRALTPTQKTLLHQALLDIYARITRGDDMAQQDQFGKTISESHMYDRKDSDDAKGGLFQ